jgi:hypothetical protein
MDGDFSALIRQEATYCAKSYRQCLAGSKFFLRHSPKYKAAVGKIYDQHCAPSTLVPPSASVILLSVVPVSVPIPMMVMIPTAGTTVPVPVKVTPALVVRCYPPCRRISRASPISSVPLVMVSSCIPIALYPHEIGTGRWRQDPHHTRGRRGPNLYSDGDLAEGECGGKDQ